MARLVEEAKKFVTENMANMKKPEASVTDVDLKGVSCDCITYNAKVEVSNHYSHSIPICDISYIFKITENGDSILLSPIVARKNHCNFSIFQSNLPIQRLQIGVLKSTKWIQHLAFKRDMFINS